MRYWMPMALRLVARVGLMAAILTWWSTQTLFMSGVVSVGTTSFIFPGHIDGISTSIEPRWQGSTSLLSCNVRNVPTEQRQDMKRDFDRSWPVTAGLLGVESRQSTNGSWGHMLHVKHWSLCLTFLIATITTSVRWRQSAEEPEQELTDE